MGKIIKFGTGGVNLAEETGKKRGKWGWGGGRGRETLVESRRKRDKKISLKGMKTSRHIKMYVIGPCLASPQDLGQCLTCGIE